MQKETKRKLNATMHRVLCLCIMAVIGVISILTVMAQTVTVQVKDGENTYSFQVTDLQVRLHDRRLHLGVHPPAHSHSAV